MIAYHGSKEKLVGAIRVNERDSGWYGNGFYATSFEDYALRWGKVLNKVSIPEGKFAEVEIKGQYESARYVGLAQVAHLRAGGSLGWVVNEHLYSKKFTEALVDLGFIGVRVHFDEHKDVEIVVFDASTVSVI